MHQRIILFLITAFWVTMICLLWRSEYGDREVGSAVPVENVLAKVLTAPDDSSLDIFHHRKKIGYCRWAPNVGEDVTASGRVSTDEYQPEGIIKKVSNYTLELEGNVTLQSLTNNLRFELTMTFSTNQTWENFRLHASMRPHYWEVSANRADEALHLVVNDESGLWEHDFAFADLQNPEKLVKEFGGPVAFALFNSMGFRTPAGADPKMSLGLKWEAHNDWMRFGHSRVRVYRLEAKLFEKLKIFVFVSRVGEILWVHLPDELVLSNNAFEHF